MNVLWGASYTFQKWGLEYMAPMHMLLARLVVALIVMTAFSYRHWPRMTRGGVIRCAALGAIIAAAHGLNFIGINKSHAVDAAILYAIEPVMAIIFARIILNERLDIWRGLALFPAVSYFCLPTETHLTVICAHVGFTVRATSGLAREYPDHSIAHYTVIEAEAA